MWEPISIDQLLVGHYVRLNYPWYAHPFLHSKFYIASQRDIDLLREQRLVKLSHDPDLARFCDGDEPAVPATPANSPADPAPVAPAAVAANSVQPVVTEGQRAKQQAMQWSREQTQRVQVCSESFARDAVALAPTVDELAAGDAGAFTTIDTLTQQVLAEAGVENARPIYVGQGFAKAWGTQAGIEGRSAMTLAALLTSQLGLDDATRRHVLLAMALHGLGARQFSASQRLDDGWTRGRGRVRDRYLDYPNIGADLLTKFECIPSEVVHVVRQHRELLDGSGFPAGLQGEAIHRGALIVGLVREFLTLTSELRAPAPMSPATVMAHFYKNRRARYGEEIVNTFVALLTVYPPGTFLEITGGDIGFVLACNPRKRLTPMIMVIDGSERFEDCEVIDLSSTAEFKVERIFRRDQLPTAGREFAWANARGGLAIDAPGASASAGAGQ